jgi:hypothetical protein
MSCKHLLRSALDRLRFVRLVVSLALVSTLGDASRGQPATSKAPAPAAESAPKPAPNATAVTDLMDWPNWRGPQQNSISTEKGLIEKWNPKDPWKRSDLGTRSTPIVMRGKLYALVRDKPGTETEGEKVVCVDAATGEQLWQYRFNVYLTDVPDTRVAWSSVAGDPETGRIYAQGVNGYFCCLEGDTGKVVWDHALHEEIGVITTYGGRTNVPVVYEDTVLISAVVVGWGGDKPEFDMMAKPSHRFMAFDKATGELRWLAGTSISPPDTTYSTPVTTVVGGEAQLIFCGSDGQVWGLQPRTGKALWNFPFSAPPRAASSPSTPRCAEISRASKSGSPTTSLVRAARRSWSTESCGSSTNTPNCTSSTPPPESSLPRRPSARAWTARPFTPTARFTCALIRASGTSSNPLRTA